ncbi:MAG: glutamate-cysteine ligase family protein, partial [Planctomycetaceae bacterium]
MPTISFASNASPTIGVEIELQLVDSETLALSNSIEQVLDALPDDLAHAIKPELMQSYLEINTGICHTVREVRDDLRAKIEGVERVAKALGIDLFWS